MEKSNNYDICGGDNGGGIFVTRTANEFMSLAAAMPDPVSLVSTLWFENEIACLFADTNMGKSIYAVQAAHAIAAEGRKVLYFDFEMTAKQFQMRYTDASGHCYRFPEGFLRVEPAADTSMCNTVGGIIACIEAEARRHDCHIIIVDNITWLCNSCESGDAAGELMQQLVRLKKDYGLSILVLAHTPKRSQHAPLTQNSLAGSKRLANFMDAMFAIGKDHTVADGTGRYIKQIKVRSAELQFGEDNVRRYVLGKQGGFLGLTPTGFATEREMLADDSDDTPDLRRSRAVELHAMGKSLREIAAELNVGRSTVARWLQ